jgi:hypothetical protein
VSGEGESVFCTVHVGHSQPLSTSVFPELHCFGSAVTTCVAFSSRKKKATIRVPPFYALINGGGVRYDILICHDWIGLAAVNLCRTGCMNYIQTPGLRHALLCLRCLIQ